MLNFDELIKTENIMLALLYNEWNIVLFKGLVRTVDS